VKLIGLIAQYRVCKVKKTDKVALDQYLTQQRPDQLKQLGGRVIQAMVNSQNQTQYIANTSAYSSVTNRGQ
jgi:hypothetical protein